MSQARTFRCHTEVPDTIVSVTLRRLAGEWVDLNNDDLCAAQLARIGLPECCTPGDVVDRIDLSDVVEQNRILLVLIEARTYLATRILVQALLPGVLSIARSRKLDRATQEDHLQLLISDLWEAIDRYPVRQRSHVALNLLRKVRTATHGLHSEGHVPLGSLREDQLVVDTDGMAPGQAARQLEEIFAVGVTYGVVSRGDVELLRAAHLHGNVSREVAEQWGISPAAVRKRCERIRARLATVAR